MGKHGTPHGTWNRYASHDCRCAACKRAWADYIASRRRLQGVPSRAQMLAVKRLRLTRRLDETGEAYRQRATAMVARFHSDAYYPDKAAAVTVRPTALGRQLLEAVQVRTGRSADDVVEALLRSPCAQRLMFEADSESLALTG